ncbi:MAG TPA: hypothetical protein VGE37_03005, partial [Archangium sp.]
MVRQRAVLTVLSLLLAANPDYDRAREALSAQRVELSAAWKKKPAETRVHARSTLLSYLEASAFPAWAGTVWDFNGTSTVPGEGKIACGYDVTTVLEQAGFAGRAIP